MNSLGQMLHELAADRFTGRVTVKSVAGGWVFLDQGAVYCAERRFQPTLLVEMGEAGLFSAAEWQYALRLPHGRPKWLSLVGGDAARLEELKRFACRYVTKALTALVNEPSADVVVANRVAHSFGVLDRWVVDSLVDTTVEARPVTPIIDRVEFLELLEEISPTVHSVRASAFSVFG